MPDNNRLEEARQILQEYIKRKHLRNTPERNAVLEATYSVGSSFTVDQLKDYLDDILPVTRVTVYNNLELLFRAGIVIKRPIGALGVEYEACIQTQTHHHLVCTVCGQIFEFKDTSIEPFFGQKRYKKFKMTHCSVVIYGVCSRCQSRINREKRKLKN